MILMRAAPGSSSASSASPGVGPIVGSSSALVLARSASLTSVVGGSLIFNFSQLFFRSPKKQGFCTIFFFIQERSHRPV
tara:strand:- start:515 stop:751 length:237 start_codon:yes stop_codon:yes gene_type:complete